ncbi:uncharacterized protein LOC9660014 isoform X3 [Selaginella moellendorffii]|uniref:uncharacterized protein LOC9660014 isoform X3 n=1 Tax=Selaginella moellendorffii TaxID=88036 RepID=UPI000D1C858C|nr:uncharacterized protein LOC9660014 isoform X3 [Selaginella moellendorffii]XP_024520522.1 uncharacterized protein LOC9660014 isoform X3 [Selaginella moellendorffii]|eukprot:XP_024520521.1 uncharacterized protein LOC9660014 isoform X3 [Selaginella moellendorffii]
MKLEEPRRRRRWSGEDWAVLPSELLDLILLRLPLLAIVRARSVCKSWNDAIQSPGFAHRKALLDHELGCVPKGWLVTLIGRYKKKWVWLYDPRSGLRHQITLPASLKGTFYEAVVVGGFIFIEAGCVNCDDNFSSRYLAWNPITGFVKELFVPQAGCLAVVSTNRSLKVYSLKPSGGGEESKKILSGLAGSWHRVAFLTYRNQFFFGHDHFENLGSGASAAAGEEVPVGAQASQLGGELAAAGGMHAAEARWEPNASVEAHRWRSSGGEVGVYQCDAGGVLRAGLPGQGDAAQLEVRGGGSSGVRLELAPPGGAAGRGGGAGLEDFQVEQRGAGSPREAALPVVGSRCVLSLVRFAGRLGHASAAKVLAGRRWDKPAEAGVSSINGVRR